MKLISNIKELSVFKIIFDLYEHYLRNYDFPVFGKLLNDYIPVAELFYTEFPHHDYAIVYEYLKEHGINEDTIGIVEHLAMEKDE